MHQGHSTGTSGVSLDLLNVTYLYEVGERCSQLGLIGSLIELWLKCLTLKGICYTHRCCQDLLIKSGKSLSPRDVSLLSFLILWHWKTIVWKPNFQENGVKMEVFVILTNGGSKNFQWCFLIRMKGFTDWIIESAIIMAIWQAQRFIFIMRGTAPMPNILCQINHTFLHELNHSLLHISFMTLITFRTNRLI